MLGAPLQALIKFNESLASNKRLREQIESLRQERSVFDSVYKRMEQQLLDKKKQMAAIIEASNQVRSVAVGGSLVWAAHSGSASLCLCDPMHGLMLALLHGVGLTRRMKRGMLLNWRLRRCSKALLESGSSTRRRSWS